MHTIFAPYKPSPAPASPLGLGKKSDHEKQVGAAVARAKAVASKRASRQEADAPVAKPKRTSVGQRMPSFGRVLTDGVDPRATAIGGTSARSCRWPIGEGESFRFCGAPAEVGYRRGALTYCAACAGLAFASRARVSELQNEAA